MGGPHPLPSQADRAKRAGLHARYAGLRGPDALQKARNAGRLSERHPRDQSLPSGPPGLAEAIETVETGRLTVEAVARAFGVDPDDLRRWTEDDPTTLPFWESEETP